MNKDSEELAHRFYSAFQKKDFETMNKCYDEKAQFTDPAFGDLNAKQTKAMWHMLCTRAFDLEINYRILQSKPDFVKVEWIAEYTYTTYQTQVRNVVTSNIKLENGLIVDQKDSFNFWKWSRQALGFTGLYLGWTPMLKSTVRKSVHKTLDKFILKNPQYA